jgi:hypothetical protein
MSPVTFATRRLWLRRWNRIGLFLLPILKIPCYPFLWVFWFFRAWIRSWSNKGSDTYFLGWIAIVIALGIVVIASWNSYLTRDATVDEIQAARKSDACFDNTIVRRAVQLNRPVNMSDILTTQSDCKEMWEKQRAMDAQKAALRSK